MELSWILAAGADALDTFQKNVVYNNPQRALSALLVLEEQVEQIYRRAVPVIADLETMEEVAEAWRALRDHYASCEEWTAPLAPVYPRCRRSCQTIAHYRARTGELYLLHRNPCEQTD